MKNLLCVEDELNLLENNRKFFEKNGFNVFGAETLAQAKMHLANKTIDAIILDIMLPDGNGLEFLKELRLYGNMIPVLLLTAWNRNADIAEGLDAGADDYIGKPFSYDVLLSRVNKMINQAERLPEKITNGFLTLDVLSGQAFMNDKNLLLTQKEFALLLLFVQNENKTMNSKYLYEKVWKTPMYNNNQTVKKHISSIRKKLGEANSRYTIIAIRGEGYCFEKV